MNPPTTRQALFLAFWGKTLHALTGSPWEAEDVQNAAEGRRLEEATALQHAYNRLEQDEGAVQAALRAALSVFGTFFTAGQFETLVDGYQRSYTSLDEALQEYLDDRFGNDELQADWFKEDAPIWDAVKRTSEVWATTTRDDDNPEATHYVFTRPGHTL